MGKSVQRSLFPISLQHGGELAKGKRKTARPLATKRAMHVVFRARTSCLHRQAGAILSLQQKLAKKNSIQVYERSNNNNHLHLLLRGKTRRGLQNFFRVFAGQIARLVGDGRLWLVPVYTRIIAWGRDFLGTRSYIIQNQLEAAGLIPYTPRKSRKRRGRPPGPPRSPGEPARHGRPR